MERVIRARMAVVENIAPPVLARMQRNWDKALRPGNAEMRFAPQDGLGFFETRGWCASVSKSLLDEAELLRLLERNG